MNPTKYPEFERSERVLQECIDCKTIARKRIFKQFVNMESDRRLTASAASTSWNNFQTIIAEDLKFRKICAAFVFWLQRRSTNVCRSASTVSWKRRGISEKNGVFIFISENKGDAFLKITTSCDETSELHYILESIFFRLLIDFLFINNIPMYMLPYINWNISTSNNNISCWKKLRNFK